MEENNRGLLVTRSAIILHYRGHMARVKKIKSPTQLELVEPLFAVLVELGGSATIDEIRDNIIKKLKLSDDVVDEPHKGNASQQTELEYQLAWARTRLKNLGAIVNSKRGVWMITPEYAGRKSITREEVTENIKAETLHSMNPYAFERLAMLLLRECGFSQVTVTKKSSDGGIDGTGKLRINGIFSFNVAFQCKRYTGSVSAGDIRDFRGSLTTDIEKGVFITTGSFTKAAREEASNAGKQQIDLIDGEEFISKLIEYGLGVKERTIYEVDKDFFERV